jgi:hypothetical protein
MIVPNEKVVKSAIKSALNSVAFECMDKLKQRVKSDLNNTTNFLERSIAYDKANDSKLESEAGFLERVWFAETLIEGGERHPLDKYIAVPIAAKSNGKVSKSMRPSKLLTRKNVFFMEHNGTKGIWKIIKGVPRLMYTLVPVTDYNEAPYIDFEGVVDEVSNSTLFHSTYYNKITGNK